MVALWWCHRADSRLVPNQWEMLQCDAVSHWLCRMSVVVTQIIANLTVCSTACWGKQQRNHQSSALLDLCEGNPPVTGGFPSQRASNAESISMSWHNHSTPLSHYCTWQIFFLILKIDTVFKVWSSLYPFGLSYTVCDAVIISTLLLDPTVSVFLNGVVMIHQHPIRIASVRLGQS